MSLRLQHCSCFNHRRSAAPRTVARWRAWPLIAAAGAAALLVFGSAIFPVFIAPLFNTFTPLPATPLTRAILHLASSQGINASVVYEYNMSIQTREANAYVSGLGATERIAVGDTLLESMPADEVLYVMAHEMGHYKLGHLWLGTFEAWVFVLAALALVATLGARLARRNRRRSRDLADPAAVPLLAALLLCFEIITMPAANALSRNIEHAADVFAGEHTQISVTPGYEPRRALPPSTSPRCIRARLWSGTSTRIRRATSG